MDATANSLGALKLNLESRLKAPRLSVSFLTQLFGVVFFCGGAGIWYTIHKGGLHADSLAAALLTYFPALVAPSVIDFVHEKQRYLRSFGISALFFFLIIFLVAVTRNTDWQLYWALIGTVLSVLLWWLANGEKDWVKDNQPGDATGGDVKRALPGSNEGWRVK
jgi:hypothetical protein